MPPSPADGKPEWSYAGIERSIQHVLDFAAQQGGFDGILCALRVAVLAVRLTACLNAGLCCRGFSQGTILATILLARRQQPENQGVDDGLGRLAVLISGVMPRAGIRNEMQPLDVPSVHLIGEQDYVKQARLLACSCAVTQDRG